MSERNENPGITLKGENSRAHMLKEGAQNGRGWKTVRETGNKGRNHKQKIGVRVSQIHR